MRQNQQHQFPEFRRPEMGPFFIPTGKTEIYNNNIILFSKFSAQLLKSITSSKIHWEWFLDSFWR